MIYVALLSSIDVAAPRLVKDAASMIGPETADGQASEVCICSDARAAILLLQLNSSA